MVSSSFDLLFVLLFAFVGSYIAIVEVGVNTFFVTFRFFSFPAVSLLFALVGFRLAIIRVAVNIFFRGRRSYMSDYLTKDFNTLSIALPWAT